MELDEEFLEKVAEEKIKEIENKEWYDMTDVEIDIIGDVRKQFSYMKKRRDCMAVLINPLYDAIPNKKSFSFSNPENLLTSKNMLLDLLNYYKNKDYTREQIMEIIKNNNSSKKR